MRCFFIEKKPKAYEELTEFLEGEREPGIELEAKNGRFEDLVPEIVEFVHGGTGTFPFLPPQQNLWVDSGSGRRPNV